MQKWKIRGWKLKATSGFEKARQALAKSLSKWIEKFLDFAEKLFDQLNLHFKHAERRYVRWTARKWVCLEPSVMESEERMGRAQERWEQARFQPGQNAWDWVAGYAKAVSDGLADPWEENFSTKVGWGTAFSLGWAALLAGRYEWEKIERAAMGGSLGWKSEDMQKCRHFYGWKIDVKYVRSTSSATERVRWLVACLKPKKHQKANNARLPFVALLVVCFVYLALLPAKILAGWLLASARAKMAQASVLHERVRDKAKAEKTAAEAILWLGNQEFWGFVEDTSSQWDVELYDWEWAGVSARPSEKLESAAWLANAAARRLPSHERAMCAACWMEGLCALLEGVDGYRFQSSDRHAPINEFFMIARGAKALRGNVACKALKEALKSAGICRFYDNSTSYRGMQGFSGSAVLALSSAAYGADRCKGLELMLAECDPVFGAHAANAVCGMDLLKEQELYGVGKGLARNPKVQVLLQPGLMLSALANSKPIELGFRSQREAMELRELLNSWQGGSNVEVENSRTKGRRL